MQFCKNQVHQVNIILNYNMFSYLILIFLIRYLYHDERINIGKSLIAYDRGKRK